MQACNPTSSLASPRHPLPKLAAPQDLAACIPNQCCNHGNREPKRGQSLPKRTVLPSFPPVTSMSPDQRLHLLTIRRESSVGELKTSDPLRDALSLRMHRPEQAGCTRSVRSAHSVRHRPLLIGSRVGWSGALDLVYRTTPYGMPMLRTLESCQVKALATRLSSPVLRCRPDRTPASLPCRDLVSLRCRRC